MQAQSLQPGMFSPGFPERVREAEKELTLMGTLQEQIDEKSRRLAVVWTSIVHQVAIPVRVRKEAFGFQFGAVEEARLDPDGSVALRISGDEVSYPLVELPSETIAAVVSASAPELLKSLRELVRVGTAGVAALEKVSSEFDRGLADCRQGAEGEARQSESAPPPSGEKGGQGAPEGARKEPVHRGTDQYAFKGSFGAPKADPAEARGYGTGVTL